MCYESGRCFTKLISVKSAKLYTISLRFLFFFGVNSYLKDQSLYTVMVKNSTDLKEKKNTSRLKSFNT